MIRNQNCLQKPLLDLEENTCHQECNIFVKDFLNLVVPISVVVGIFILILYQVSMPMKNF